MLPGLKELSKTSTTLGEGTTVILCTQTKSLNAKAQTRKPSFLIQLIGGSSNRPHNFYGEFQIKIWVIFSTFRLINVQVSLTNLRPRGWVKLGSHGAGPQLLPALVTWTCPFPSINRLPGQVRFCWMERNLSWWRGKKSWLLGGQFLLRIQLWKG